MADFGREDHYLYLLFLKPLCSPPLPPPPLPPSRCPVPSHPACFVRYTPYQSGFPPRTSPFPAPRGLSQPTSTSHRQCPVSRRFGVGQPAPHAVAACHSRRCPLLAPTTLQPPSWPVATHQHLIEARAPRNPPLGSANPLPVLPRSCGPSQPTLASSGVSPSFPPFLGPPVHSACRRTPPFPPPDPPLPTAVHHLLHPTGVIYDVLCVPPHRIWRRLRTRCGGPLRPIAIIYNVLDVASCSVALRRPAPIVAPRSTYAIYDVLAIVSRPLLHRCPTLRTTLVTIPVPAPGASGALRAHRSPPGPGVPASIH
ncbi:hypothetical protein B0H10DRAFT_2220745 [Mycena sp. CBHHK59/15]|nr:hypothetical protein B0H10DRAFT_2220745 [Mycena sp. CBHHK59/15]